MEDIINVNMLGEFSISYNGKVLDSSNNRSKKIWMILEYLIMFREKEITQSDLIELLWPDDDVGDPANTLKILIHRVRHSLATIGLDGKKLITASRGAYSWNSNDFEMNIDVDRFEKLCAEAETEIDGGSALGKLLDAIAIYKGDFLPQSAYETWVVPLGTYYHNKYLKAVKDTVSILAINERYEDVIAICRDAAVIAPYDETIHMILVSALVSIKDNRAALKHYDFVTDMFYTKFGITPSQEFLNLYKTIAREENSVETDLGIIKDNMKEDEDESGAFYCEYGVFKEICKLESRALMRTGQVIYLCLITIDEIKSSEIDKKKMNTAMSKMMTIIKKTLRSGDVYCRFSLSQYLIMLSGATFENSEMVMGRIADKFRRENTRINMSVSLKIQALDPRKA